MWLNYSAVHLKLTQHWKSTILSFLKINKKNKIKKNSTLREDKEGFLEHGTKKSVLCLHAHLLSPTEAQGQQGCRWGHQLCGVDEISRSIFPLGLGKHLEPRLRKTEDDDKIVAEAEKSLTVIRDSGDAGWQGGSSWHWARWHPWLILFPLALKLQPLPDMCTDTRKNGLRVHWPLCHSAAASGREGLQTRSPASRQDLLGVKKIFENCQELWDPNTPPKETIKIQNQSQMNWRELSWWEKVNLERVKPLNRV